MEEISLDDLAFKIKKFITNYKLKDFPLEKYKIKNILKFINLEKNKYNRNVVYRDENFEIIIINWYPGSIANFHRHPENGCLLKLIYGCLQETLKYNNNKIKTKILNENDSSYLDDTIGIHHIEALKPTMSLHIYSPPNFYN